MAPLRLAIGGIFHETNTYADDCTGTTGLDRFEVLRGDEIVERHRGNRTHIGGMLAAADEAGIEVVPLCDAVAMPSGTVEREAYDVLKAELLDAARSAAPFDAIALTVHGAGVVDGIEDLEADLAEAVREALGPEPKIVAVLDLHGNISSRMVERYDLLLGVHLYPHTDFYERGEELVRLLPALVAGEVAPVTVVEPVPILLPTSTTDPGNPAAAMNELCAAMEERPGVLDCTVFHGFSHADVPDAGLSVMCTTTGDADLAVATASEVGAWVWANRDRFRPETHLPESAIRLALSEPAGPVVVNETSDNSGGGAPGDGTHLLRALLDAERGDARCVFGSIFDPGVVDVAHRAGVGATIDVELGGKHDRLHGDPVRVRGYVKALTDGRIVLSTPMGAGMAFDLGRCARLVVDGVDIVVASHSLQTLDEQIFLLHGIDVRRYHLVALKSSQHFRAGFRDLAAAIITADGPGLTGQRTELLRRTRATRPMWPLDPAATYTPTHRQEATPA